MNQQSSSSSSSSSLSHVPNGWIKAYSNSQRRDYFYHKATNRSVWKLSDIDVEDVCNNSNNNNDNNGRINSNTDNSINGNAVIIKQNDNEDNIKQHDDEIIIHSASITINEKVSMIENNNRDDEFQSSIRSRLIQFQNQQIDTSLHFDPYESVIRYSILEVVGDFPELISRTEENIDGEKFIAVYKFGFVPDNMPIHQKIIPTMKRKKKKDDPPPPPLNSKHIKLDVIGTVKRDRRTIEQVELEKKTKLLNN
jgi:hypothetical protein